MKKTNASDLIDSSDIKGIIIENIVEIVNEKIKQKKWTTLFLKTGDDLIRNIDEQEKFKDDLKNLFSKENLKMISKTSYEIRGYELPRILENELRELFVKYRISNNEANEYIYYFIQNILDEIKKHDSIKALEVYLENWRIYLQKNYSTLNQQLQNLTAEVSKLNVKCIFSLEDIEKNLKKDSKYNNMGLDFFEINDEDFEMEFKRQINNEAIYIVGNSKEETLYRILSYLKETFKNSNILVISSKDSWNRLYDADISNCILIPYFYSDTIQVINNNTNIFIYNLDEICYNENKIILRKRTYRNLYFSLKKIGLNDEEATDLLRNTNGIYEFMKRKLFNYASYERPKWVEEKSNSVIAALVCGAWTESEGDKEVLSKLAGKNYDLIIQELQLYSTVEKPSVIKIKKHGLIYYSIASIEDAWQELDSFISQNFWNRYISLLKVVFDELEPIFNYDYSHHYLVNIIEEKPKYSKILKNAMLRTLIMETLYKGNKEFQYQVDEVVEELLDNIKNVKQWACISQYFITLCEVSPKSVLKRIEDEFNLSTGLRELFKNNTSNIFFETNYYVNIISGLEQLVHIRKYIFKTLHCLFMINDFNIEYTISNSPQDTLGVIFCPQFNSCALQASEKIKFAEKAFKQYKSTWNIISKQLPNSHSQLFSLYQPKYRMIDIVDRITKNELIGVYKKYLQLCSQYAGTDRNRWEIILDHLDRYEIDIQKNVLSQMIEQIKLMNDLDKEYLKTKIRYIIFRHRFFCNSQWAMSKEKLDVYEDVLDKIIFQNPVFDYVYLFRKVKFPILNPIPYKENENDILKNNEKSRMMDDFISKQYDIDDLITIVLSLHSYYYDLGTVLAEFYCKLTYDRKILNILIQKDETGEQVFSYVSKLYYNKKIELENILNDIKELTNNENIIANILSLQSVNGEDNVYIFDENINVKTLYWKKQRVGIIFKNANKKIILHAINECQKYGNLENYLMFLYDMKDNISIQELYDNFIKVINMEFDGNTSMLNFYLQEILKIIQTAYFNDDEKCNKIAKIEWYFSNILNWDEMICLQKIVKFQPLFYAKIIHHIFKDKNGNDNKSINESLKKHFIDCFFNMKFCPAEKSGNIDYKELKKWLKDFKELLVKQNQDYLFEDLVGKLFANAPVGKDGYPPHESVRNIIEEYKSEKLEHSYVSEEMNKRGIYSPNAGKTEKEISKKYFDISKYLEIEYPFTAEIFNILGENYERESLKQREDAENE